MVIKTSEAKEEVIEIKKIVFFSLEGGEWSGVGSEKESEEEGISAFVTDKKASFQNVSQHIRLLPSSLHPTPHPHTLSFILFKIFSFSISSNRI